MMIAACSFGIVFNIFWTSVTFLLSAEPFHYSTFQIGLVSLTAITGALAAMKVGSLQDRGLGVKATASIMIKAGGTTEGELSFIASVVFEVCLIFSESIFIA